MNFDYTDKVKKLRADVQSFMNDVVYPNEPVYHEQFEAQSDRWQTPQIIEDMKVQARDAGLWNLFLPESERGAGLTNLEYAPLCEIMGRSHIAPEVFNCAAPDTGNMEVLERYGSEDHKKTWLEPLLDGKIRSAFAMTEPKVASSDATNIESSITRDGDEYVLNGHKWWISGAGDPRCKILIFMGKTDPAAERHKQQSMILVPTETPGVEITRPLLVYGYDPRAARPLGNDLHRRACAGFQHAARRGPRVRDRARPPGAGPHPSLHAPDRGRRTAALTPCAPGPRHAPPSARRWRNRAWSWTPSRALASRSSRPAFLPSRRPT